MRTVLALIVAWVAASIAVVAVQSLIFIIDPTGLSGSDPSRLLLILLLFGDILGGFVAGIVAALVGKRGDFQAVWLTLILLTVSRIVMIFFEDSSSQQMVSVMSVFGIPFAILLGGRIVQRLQKKVPNTGVIPVSMPSDETSSAPQSEPAEEEPNDPPEEKA